MVKKLFSLVMLITLCVGMNAQTFQFGGKANLKSKGKALLAPPSRAAGSYDFTYFPGDIETDADDIQLFGLGKNATANSQYNVAIFVPASKSGQSISAVKYCMETANYKDMKVWVSSELPSDWGNAENYANSVNMDENGYVTANFNTPVAISDKGCYVGYTFTMTSNSEKYDQYPVTCAQLSTATSGSLYLACNNPTVAWTDMAEQKVASTITLTLNATDIASNSVSFVSTSLGTAYGVVGKEYTVKANVINNSAELLSSVSYIVKDLSTNEVSAEKTVTLANPVKTYKTGEVVFNADAENELSSYNKEITITKFNGAKNEASEKTAATFSLTTLSKMFDRKVVEEEATATGCAPCARGYAGMKALHDKYPDSWIGIAAHITGINYNDPMYCSAYNAVTNKASGVPAAWLNRINAVDPYFGSGGDMLGIYDDMDAELAKPAVAGITASAKWDADMNKISVTTNVEFGFNSDKADYGIAYVLLANGLKAPENSKYPSRWYQNDAYYGYDAGGEKYIEEWCNKQNVKKTNYGYLVTDMVYDHIAIAAKGISTGVNGSIVAPIVAGNVQTHNAEFDLTKGISNSVGDDLIQDKSKLEVVAMLIDKSTGEIANADKVEISGGQTGISNVNASSAATEVARYSLDGMQLSAPQKGLNIVKLSDGRTVKVMVK